MDPICVWIPVLHVMRAFEPLALSVHVSNGDLNSGCQSKLGRPGPATGCVSLALANSAITTQETGAEDRKCGFLWFYRTISPFSTLPSPEL